MNPISALFHIFKPFIVINAMYILYTEIKGIVSRDWGGLQMILLDRLEVFNISASGFFKFCCRFYTVILKMAA